MYIPEEVINELEQYKKEKKYEKALELAQQWLKKDPTNKQLLYQIADIQYLMGELEKAEKPIDFLLTTNENDWSSLYIKWLLHMEKLERWKAKQYFKKAILALQDENPELYRAYWLAEYWYWNRERWIQFLQQALNLSKKRDAEILYNLTEIYLLQKEFKKAYNLINHFIKNQEKLFYPSEEEKQFYLEKFQLFKKYIDNWSLHNQLVIS